MAGNNSHGDTESSQQSAWRHRIITAIRTILIRKIKKKTRSKQATASQSRAEQSSAGGGGRSVGCSGSDSLGARRDLSRPSTAAGPDLHQASPRRRGGLGRLTSSLPRPARSLVWRGLDAGRRRRRRRGRHGARGPPLPRTPRSLPGEWCGLVKTGDRRGWAFIVGERGIRGEKFRLGRRKTRNGPGCAGRAYWGWWGGMEVGPDYRESILGVGSGSGPGFQ